MNSLQVNNYHLLKKNPNLLECLTLHIKPYSSISINTDDYNQLHIDEKIIVTISILGIKNDQISYVMIPS